MPATRTPVAKPFTRVPSIVKPTIEAARRLVASVAPHTVEVGYQSHPPRSRSALWKLVRYTVDGTNVVGIGTFPTYALLFFYRGRELGDRTGLLEGSGKKMRFIRLRSPADVRDPEVRRAVRKAFTLAGQRPLASR